MWGVGLRERWVLAVVAVMLDEPMLAASASGRRLEAEKLVHGVPLNLF